MVQRRGGSAGGHEGGKERRGKEERGREDKMPPGVSQSSHVGYTSTRNTTGNVGNRLWKRGPTLGPF